MAVIDGIAHARHYSNAYATLTAWRGRKKFLCSFPGSSSGLAPITISSVARKIRALQPPATSSVVRKIRVLQHSENCRE